MSSIENLAKLLEGDALTQWAIAAALSAAILLVALLVRLFLSRGLPSPQPGKDLHWPEVLHELVTRTWTLFLIIAAIYAGTTLLDLPDSIHRLVSSVFIIALFVQIAVWADRIASALLTWRLAPLEGQSSMRNALALIQFAVRVAVWSIALLLIFENLGLRRNRAGRRSWRWRYRRGARRPERAWRSVFLARHRPRSALRGRRFHRVRQSERHGGEDRYQDHAHPRAVGRASRSFEQRPRQDARSQLQAYGPASYRARAGGHLRHPGRQARQHSRHGDEDHRGAG